MPRPSVAAPSAHTTCRPTHTFLLHSAPPSRFHPPPPAIVQSFDELLLLKRGGETIYSGPLGKDADALISYLQVCVSRVLERAWEACDNAACFEHRARYALA